MATIRRRSGHGCSSSRDSGSLAGRGPAPLCDKIEVTVRSHLVRVHLKRVLFIPILACTFVAQTAPLAMVVLNTAGWYGGRMPAGWEIKVNHGKPVVSVCKDADTACLHLLSVSSSFSLEKSVDVDPAQMPYLTWSWKVAQLPGGGAQQVFAGQGGFGVHQGHHILQLIAKTISAAGLVKAGASPEAAA